MNLSKDFPGKILKYFKSFFFSFLKLFRCACLADITSCILADDESKIESEQSISPLKEPLKKKGNDITNPYPNFKVCATHVKLVINMILYQKNAQKAVLK